MVTPSVNGSAAPCFLGSPGCMTLWAVWDELGWSAARRLSYPDLYCSLTCIKLNSILRKEAVYLAYFLIIFPFIAARICSVRYFVPRFLLGEELDWKDGKEEGENGKWEGVLHWSAIIPCRTLHCLFLKKKTHRKADQHYGFPLISASGEHNPAAGLVQPVGRVVSSEGRNVILWQQRLAGGHSGKREPGGEAGRWVVVSVGLRGQKGLEMGEAAFASRLGRWFCCGVRAEPGWVEKAVMMPCLSLAKWPQEISLILNSSSSEVRVEDFAHKCEDTRASCLQPCSFPALVIPKLLCALSESRA